MKGSLKAIWPGKSSRGAALAMKLPRVRQPYSVLKVCTDKAIDAASSALENSGMKRP